MDVVNFFKRVTTSAAGKTAAERIRAEKEAVTRQYELMIAKADAKYSAGTQRVENEVKLEVEGIENSIALAIRRAEALKETGAINEEHQARLDSALKASSTR